MHCILYASVFRFLLLLIAVVFLILDVAKLLKRLRKIFSVLEKFLNFRGVTESTPFIQYKDRNRHGNLLKIPNEMQSETVYFASSVVT